MLNAKPSPPPKPAEVGKSNANNKKPLPIVSPKPHISGEIRRGSAPNITTSSFEKSSISKTSHPRIDGEAMCDESVITNNIHGADTEQSGTGDDDLQLSHDLGNNTEGSPDDRGLGSNTAKSAGHQLLPPPVKPKPKRSLSPLPPSLRGRNSCLKNDLEDNVTNDSLQNVTADVDISTRPSDDESVTISDQLNGKSALESIAISSDQDDINSDISKSKNLRDYDNESAERGNSDKSFLLSEMDQTATSSVEDTNCNNAAVSCSANDSAIISDSGWSDEEDRDQSNIEDKAYINCNSNLNVLSRNSNANPVDSQSRPVESVSKRPPPLPPLKPQSKAKSSLLNDESDVKSLSSPRLVRSSSYECALEAGMEKLKENLEIEVTCNNENEVKASSDEETKISSPVLKVTCNDGDQEKLSNQDEKNTKYVPMKKPPAPPPKSPRFARRVVASSNENLGNATTGDNIFFGNNLTPDMIPSLKREGSLSGTIDMRRRRSEGFLMSADVRQLDREASSGCYEPVYHDISDLYSGPGAIHCNPDHTTSDSNTEEASSSRDDLDNRSRNTSASSPKLRAGHLFGGSKGKGPKGDRRDSEPSVSGLSIFYQSLDDDPSDISRQKNSRNSNSATAEIAAEISREVAKNYNNKKLLPENFSSTGNNKRIPANTDDSTENVDITSCAKEIYLVPAPFSYLIPIASHSPTPISNIPNRNSVKQDSEINGEGYKNYQEGTYYDNDVIINERKTGNKKPLPPIPLLQKTLPSSDSDGNEEYSEVEINSQLSSNKDIKRSSSPSDNSHSIQCDLNDLEPRSTLKQFDPSLHLSHSAVESRPHVMPKTKRHRSDNNSDSIALSKKLFANNGCVQSDSGTSSASSSSNCVAGSVLDLDDNGNTTQRSEGGRSSIPSSVSSSFSSAAGDSLVKFRQRHCLGTESLRSDTSSRFSDISGCNVYEDVDDYEDLNEQERVEMKNKQKTRRAFLTVQEMLTSEQTFVNVLHLLCHDFPTAVQNSRDGSGRPVVAASLVSQIIKYLPQLLPFNEDLLHDLKDRVKNWEQDPRVADIFVKKGAFLKLYTDYIRDFNSMVELLDESRRRNADFDRVVTEFEVGPRCAKLALKHYMLKPIQRIPQYRLLLREYFDHLLPDSLDYKNAQDAILIVHQVAEHANQSMKYGDNLNKMLEIQNSLIGQFEVIKPGRILIKEGMLEKLSRKEMQPRMFFLFSDVLLYTTPIGGGYKLNNILPLYAMKVSKPTKADFQNEFSIITTQRSFTISAGTEEEREEWLTVLETAIKDNIEKRLSYKQDKLVGHAKDRVNVEINANDFKLGTKAPVWIPDSRVSMCMICTSEFTVSFRRHHCRSCGKVVCGLCSDFRAPLRYLQFKPERVCHECYTILSIDIDAMDPNATLVATPDGLDGGTLATDSRRRRSSEGGVTISKESIKAQFRGVTLATIGRAKGKKKPAILQEVHANDDYSEMSGYLKVYKSRRWRKMWFVLKSKVLYTFKASEDAAAEESLVLLGFQVSSFNTHFQGVEPQLLFELSHPGMPSQIFRAESSLTREKWMTAMQQATVCT